MIFAVAAGAVLVLVLCFFLLTYMRSLAFSHHITNETITLPVQMEDNHILFISDIHRRQLKPGFFRTFSKTPDMVWIGGDLAERGVNEKTLKHNLKVLSSIAPVYFVFGNNDYEWPEASFTRILHQFNVTILKNSAVTFKDTWTLSGIDDMNRGIPEFETALKGSRGPVILLSHNPEAAWAVSGFDKVVCVVSGHTHGGQIRLGPFGIAEKAGWTLKGGKPVFISSGYGTTQIPLRLGTKAECHVLRIKGCS
ncbi:metallophosphoesterase [Alteribacter keqinensis]|nr:metallophosphoesterase [Alteribacter keqinensis]